MHAVVPLMIPLTPAYVLATGSPVHLALKGPPAAYCLSAYTNPDSLKEGRQPNFLFTGLNQ